MKYIVFNFEIPEHLFKFMDVYNELNMMIEFIIISIDSNCLTILINKININFDK